MLQKNPIYIQGSMKATTLLSVRSKETRILLNLFFFPSAETLCSSWQLLTLHVLYHTVRKLNEGLEGELNGYECKLQRSRGYSHGSHVGLLIITLRSNSRGSTASLAFADTCTTPTSNIRAHTWTQMWTMCTHIVRY